MIEPDYKHVLFKDLKDYIRKRDYMSGFTAIELAFIRKNIGAASELDVSRNAYEVKYDDLRKLIVQKALNPGSVYIITDFKSIYSSNLKNEDGQYITYGDKLVPSNTYTLFTIAKTENTLFRSIEILSSDPESVNWYAEYDPILEVLPDGVKTMGKITYLEDLNHNKANYDFKNVRTYLNGYNYYTFSTYTGEENSNNCYYNDLCFSKHNLLFLSCNHNTIWGNYNLITRPINNFHGRLEGIRLSKTGLDDDTVKQSLIYEGKYYLDYLDVETLTHLFYELSFDSNISS